MLLALLLGWSIAAWAQDAEDANERARELYENGATLYDEGRYEDAIVAWQEAWELSQRPLLLYNIASAQERLGHWRDALETLNRYRAYARPDERERLDRRIANLERRIAADGDGGTLRPRTDGTTTGSGSTLGAGEGGMLTSMESIPPTSGPRWLPPTALGVGGVGVATGVIFALRAQGARSEAAELCLTGASGLLCPDSAADALRRDRVSSLVADGAFLLGGAGLLGGAALVVFTDAPVVVGPGGLLVRGHF